LERVLLSRGVPANIRTDNGPEFISQRLEQWCTQKGITMQYIQPSKLMQNAYIERKNGSMRRELLDAYVFTSLAEVRSLCQQWREDYNEERPHKALGYLSPVKYQMTREKDATGRPAALSTPASETLNQIEAQPIVDKAIKQKLNPPVLN
jgi:putative transposase